MESEALKQSAIQVFKLSLSHSKILSMIITLQNLNPNYTIILLPMFYLGVRKPSINTFKSATATKLLLTFNGKNQQIQYEGDNLDTS